MRAGPGRRLVVAGAAALAALLVAASLPGCTGAPRFTGAPIRTLALDRWQLQSSARVQADGAAISKPGYTADGWYPTAVPSTVLAALTAAGVYGDPYYGTNLEHLPESDFIVPWWYRTEFTLPAGGSESFTRLHLDGINYRAEVWLNGHLIADRTHVVGTFRAFEFDVTDVVRPGRNALAVQVFPVDPWRDLTITWVDWNPMPPDHGMGIWQPVYLTLSGPVSLRDPQVVSELALPGLETADLTVTATVRNDADHAVTAEVEGSIGDIRFSTSVDLGPGESKLVWFDPQRFTQLRLDHPRVWWPYQMGSQPMYSLALTVRVDGAESDRTSTGFGIRDVGSELRGGHRVFLANGKPILIRGGGWASDMLLRPQPDRTAEELLYVRDLGLNTIRLEGKLESDHFYDLADRLGILILPGWMCCDRWQRTAGWTDEDRVAAQGSMYSQALRLRNHPSVIAFLIGSDTAPPPQVEGLYLQALHRANWPDPIIASASDEWTPELGRTGFKMTGPYEWIPPSYWYSPRAPGGADGFNTETSAGASIPELENLRRMLTPAELAALWRDPSAGQYHAGTEDSTFHDFAIFDAAMAARLGPPTSLADYVEKAQVLNYEAVRAMFEAFSRNRYEATGVIQWMMQNAWPSLHWNLFDWFLGPNGSYFGAKKANEPLHVQYSYDDRSIVVVNEAPESAIIAATARIFNIDGSLRYEKTMPLTIGADSSRRVFTLPEIRGLSSTYFVELLLRDAKEQVVSWNDYWLSTTAETLDRSRADWYYTPTQRYADLTGLSRLPSVRPMVTACSANDGANGTTSVTIANRSSSIAFFIRVRLTRGAGGRDVLPVRWTDNYVTLMPGERQTLVAHYRLADLGGADPALAVGGWNVPDRSLTNLAACA